MRGEYDALDQGHLGWAMGSLGAVSLREIRTNWLFYCGILLAVLLNNLAYPKLVFALANFDMAFFKAHFYQIFILAPVPYAFLLGLWKPGRAMTIAVLGGYIGNGIGGTLIAATMLGGSFFEWFFRAMWMDTLPVYQGAIVVAGIWWVSAAAGGLLRRRIGRARLA
ncbi:MAG: hypothetical protein ABL914_03180 [Novosphingobium sp.]|uniref:hypothetical protein n=1 Tax=Novosphingobium sp. TaxID=1874826 RepID=UPI0032BCB674